MFKFGKNIMYIPDLNILQLDEGIVMSWSVRSMDLQPLELLKIWLGVLKARGISGIR